MRDQGRKWPERPAQLLAILGRRQGHDPEIQYYRARMLTVVARPPLPVQVDGDPIGFTPMTFEVAPGALRALLPRDLPEDLLQQKPAEASPPPSRKGRLPWRSGRLLGRSVGAADASPLRGGGRPITPSRTTTG
ncbi:MAG: hypothetical protein N2378_13575 [Chloroflexaceae bacterium]|nr:hypothetical protein [Chloroflexaceae bacterium]